jgi:hypothetical protein
MKRNCDASFAATVASCAWPRIGGTLNRGFGSDGLLKSKSVRTWPVNASCGVFDCDGGDAGSFVEGDEGGSGGYDSIRMSGLFVTDNVKIVSRTTSNS